MGLFLWTVLANFLTNLYPIRHCMAWILSGFLTPLSLSVKYHAQRAETGKGSVTVLNIISYQGRQIRTTRRHQGSCHNLLLASSLRSKETKFRKTYYYWTFPPFSWGFYLLRLWSQSSNLTPSHMGDVTFGKLPGFAVLPMKSW